MYSTPDSATIVFPGDIGWSISSSSFDDGSTTIGMFVGS